MEVSNVRYSDDGQGRHGKILTVLGLTNFDGQPGIRSQTIYASVSAFLAWRELETRSGAILPNLPGLLEGCDFHWDYEARDTKFAPLEAARQLLKAANVLDEEEVLAPSSTAVPAGDSSPQAPTEVITDQIVNSTQPPLHEPIRNDTEWDNVTDTVVNATQAPLQSTSASPRPSPYTPSDPPYLLTSQSTSQNHTEVDNVTDTIDSSIPLPLQSTSSSSQQPTSHAPSDRPSPKPSSPSLAFSESPIQPTLQSSYAPSDLPSQSLSLSPSHAIHESPLQQPAETSRPSPQLESTDIDKPRTPPPRQTETPRTPPPRETDQPLTEAHYMLHWILPNGRPQQNQANKTEQSTRRQLHVHEYATFHNDSANQGRPQANRRAQSQPISASSVNEQPPFAMIGDFSSRISKTLGILGNALGIPQISGSSTSADLNDLPLFARTIPTDDTMAAAFVYYLQSLNVTHFANIYVKDAYGTSFHQSLRNYADLFNITMQGISYSPGKESDVVKSFKDGRLRYVFATVVEWQELVRVAFDQQVIGVPGYAWFLSEKFILTSPTFELSKETEAGVAQALSGIGLINFHSEPSEGLSMALLDFAAPAGTNHTSLQKEYIGRNAHPEIFDVYTFPQYNPSTLNLLHFDAVIAMGLASCQTLGLFTGPDLIEQLLNVDFEGVTGRVSFDEQGNRKLEGVEYRVDNLRLSENRSDSSYFRFDSSLAAIISKGNVTEITPFLFANRGNMTTTIPVSLPPVEEDMNYIESWALAFGLLVGSFVIFLSVVLMAWTWWKRNSIVIRMAQPPFLIQICVGTAIIAATVFPLSLGGGGVDEATNRFKYTAACNAKIWTLSLGFVTSFSAIFSKAWRINKLLHAGNRIRRIKVKAIDVIKPFVVLLTINVAMLLGLTFVAPFEFQRIQMNDVDAWGRPVASYGTCVASSNLILVFLLPMIVSNVVCVLVAGWQCYKGRNLPVDNQETHYLGISMASLLETTLLSAPVLFAVSTRPTSFFVFASAAVSVLALSILVPVFLPKWLQRHQEAVGRRTQINRIADAARKKRSSSNRFTTNSPNSNRLPPANSEFSDESCRLSQSESTYGIMKVHRNSKGSRSQRS